MNHILTWCEIPVTDMPRAKAFYSEVLDVNFIHQEMEGFEMAMFTEDPELISGALVKGETYEPSKQGSVVYLNAGDNLFPVLQRAQAQGAEVLWPKTPIDGGEKGYFAQFVDCEGNRVGLYSLN